jgi:pyruvate/2-oxoglutarate dehydrogenase complex dihydrolipoamide dehydrogenase (E3) component
MQEKLAADGIRFYLGSKILEVKRENNGAVVVIEGPRGKEYLACDRVLVALGREPSTKSLDLEKAGIEPDRRGYVVTDNKLRTGAGNVYACGDCTGPYQFTHMSEYQAQVVVQNLVSPFKKKVDYSFVPWVTFTKPEVAHVGFTEQAAREHGRFGRSIYYPLARADRARTEGEDKGFIKIVMCKCGKIKGATIVAEKAGEMIELAALAIKNELQATAFADMIFPYPIDSEIYKAVSYELRRENFRPWMKRIIKIFL